MRINFNYFISEAVVDYIVEAVRLVARDGWRMLEEYRFDPGTGIWIHRNGLVEPPLRLGQIDYGPDGEMRYPRSPHTAPESALAGYLAESAQLLSSVSPPQSDAPATQVSADFDHLRWFELPPDCIATT
jgi:hypothetical protein